MLRICAAGIPPQHGSRRKLRLIRAFPGPTALKAGFADAPPASSRSLWGVGAPTNIPSHLLCSPHSAVHPLLQPCPVNIQPQLTPAHSALTTLRGGSCPPSTFSGPGSEWDMEDETVKKAQPYPTGLSVGGKF